MKANNSYPMGLILSCIFFFGSPLVSIAILDQMPVATTEMQYGVVFIVLLIMGVVSLALWAFLDSKVGSE